MQKPRLLLVDDEAPIRTFASEVLRLAGYDVHTAADGPEALRALDDGHTFDAFVLDVMMPQMRGDELAAAVRRRNPDAKVLYFTGYSDLLFKEKVALWEGEAFIDKPVTPNGLLEAVSLLLFNHTRGPARLRH
jgi:two-component system cell cycle sensor histidine kinase/response regulator CckA